MNLSYKIVAYLIIVLGIAHQLFAALGGKFNLNVLWFLGSGFAIIFAGFLNVALLRIEPKDTLVRALCAVTNVTVTVLFAVAYFTVLSEPQVIVGILLFALAAVFSLLLKNE
ncbi:MAG: hypothetical protein H0U87_00660 [Acidobacteria bacterium]|jgi:hypothetical protein|nr:hypothetical protein [Acidobacteriota bacterium]